MRKRRPTQMSLDRVFAKTTTARVIAIDWGTGTRRVITEFSDADSLAEFHHCVRIVEAPHDQVVRVRRRRSHPASISDGSPRVPLSPSWQASRMERVGR